MVAFDILCRSVSSVPALGHYLTPMSNAYNHDCTWYKLVRFPGRILCILGCNICMGLIGLLSIVRLLSRLEEVHENWTFLGWRGGIWNYKHFLAWAAKG